jgi:hypothetical protein
MGLSELGFFAGLDEGLESLLRVGFAHRVLTDFIPQKIESHLSLVRSLRCG